MKIIGIVAVTTVGACICANQIIAEAAILNPDGVHPEFIMHAFSFHEYKKLVIKKDWESLANLILLSIEKLKKMNAEFIIIPSNTPHYGVELIQKKSSIPVLNLIEITADECFQKGYKKVCVLGTKATMMDGLYRKYLEPRSIQVVIPNSKDCDAIENLIMNEIIPLKSTRFEVANHVAENILTKIDCDAFILGCTELPEVYDAVMLNKSVIDTTRLLAKKALIHSMYR